MLTTESISELRANPSQTNFCKLVELSGWNGGYTTGGNIEIYPRNTKNKVERMKHLLNFSVNYVFTIEGNSSKKPSIPSPISSDTFLYEYIDMNGPLSKHDMIKLRDLMPAEEY